MDSSGNSPLKSGGVGVQFEEQVATHYLIAMLANESPRGLPNIKVNRVIRQQDDVYPLDDIVIEGEDRDKNIHTLQVQSKRSITFSREDTPYTQVVEQIAKAIKKRVLSTGDNKLGVAFNNTTPKIESSYQNVISRSHNFPNADAFFKRLGVQGVYNEDMKTFVNNLEELLSQYDINVTKDIVWSVLKSLKLLYFDYEKEGSTSVALDRIIATKCLCNEDKDRVDSFISKINQIALKISASGGEINRDMLIEKISSEFKLEGLESNMEVFRKISDDVEFILNGIKDDINQVVLMRNSHIKQVHNALESGANLIEITGEAGVGKSGILKKIAMEQCNDGCCLVISPNRHQGGGISSVLHHYGYSGIPTEFLKNLAIYGKGFVYIDNIDRLNLDEMQTVHDIIISLKDIRGLKVLMTSRGNNQRLLSLVNNTVGLIFDTVYIPELSEDDVAEINSELPHLGHLFHKNHPTHDVMKNLFILSLVAEGSINNDIISEIDVINSWFSTGGCKKLGLTIEPNDDSVILEIQRLLIQIGKSNLEDITYSVNAGEINPEILSILLKDNVLSGSAHKVVDFIHDVFRQWCMFIYALNNPNFIDLLETSKPASALHSRVISLVAQNLLEKSDCVSKWEELYRKLNIEGNNSSWARAVLLSLVRSDKSVEALKKAINVLLENDSKHLISLIKTIQAVDVKQISAPGVIRQAIYLPADKSWFSVTVWVGLNIDKITDDMIPVVIDFLYKMGTNIKLCSNVVGLIMKWLLELLLSIENSQYRSTAGFYERVGTGSPKYYQYEKKIRQIILLNAEGCEEVIKSYLVDLKNYLNNNRKYQYDMILVELMRHTVYLAPVASRELCDLIFAVLTCDEDRQEFSSHCRTTFSSFDSHGNFVFNQDMFFKDLILSDSRVGIKFFLKLSKLVENKHMPNDTSCASIVVPYNGKKIIFSRFECSDLHEEYVLREGYKALIYWVNESVENGTTAEELAEFLFCSDELTWDFAKIALYIILKTFPLSKEFAIPFLSTTALLPCMRNMSYSSYSGFYEELLTHRIGLNEIVAYYCLSNSSFLKQLKTNLLEAKKALPDYSTGVDYGDESLLTQNIINRLDVKNYTLVTKFEDGREITQYPYNETDQEKQCLEPLRKPNPLYEEFISIRLDYTHTIKEINHFVEVAKAQLIHNLKINKNQCYDIHKFWQLGSILKLAFYILLNDIKNHLLWAKTICIEVAEHTSKHNYIQYAFAGLLICNSHDEQLAAELILRLVCDKYWGITDGLDLVLKHKKDFDCKIVTSIIRCAVVSEIYPNGYRSSNSDESHIKLLYKERVEQVVEDELNWLLYDSPEPQFPVLACPNIIQEGGLRVGVGRVPDNQIQHSSEHFSGEYTYKWLLILENSEVDFNNLNYKMSTSYINWALEANGLGLQDNIALNVGSEHFSEMMINFSARCFAIRKYRNSIKQIISNISWGINDLVYKYLKKGKVNNSLEYLIKRICKLPNEIFQSIYYQVQVELDYKYLCAPENRNEYIYFRTMLSNKLISTWGYKGKLRNFSSNVDYHYLLLLMMTSHSSKVQRDVLVDYVKAFFPYIENIILSSSSSLIVSVGLVFIEKYPELNQESLFYSCITNCFSTHSDKSEFWVETGIGEKACNIGVSILDNENNSYSEQEIRQLSNYANELIQIGIVNAVLFEKACARLL